MNAGAPLLFPLDIHIFVASSSVLMPERRIIETIVGVLSQKRYHARNVQLKPIFWENESRNANLAPEDAIIHGLRRPRDCQVCLFLFSNWFGSPGVCERVSYQSGTEWELEDARQRVDGELIVFRKDVSGTALAVKSIDDIEAASQWMRLVDFFRREFHHNDGSFKAHYETFSSADLERAAPDSATSFENKVTRDLRGAIDRTIDKSVEHTASILFQYLTAHGQNGVSRAMLQLKYELSAERLDAVHILLVGQEKLVTFDDHWYCRHN